MKEALLNHHTATVQDVQVPGSSKNLEELLREVINLLQAELDDPKGGSIELFKKVFMLLSKFGIPGTVFQTGNLKCKNEDDKTFIFTGAYELKKDDTVYYDRLSSRTFDAVVICEIEKTPGNQKHKEE